ATGASSSPPRISARTGLEHGSQGRAIEPICLANVRHRCGLWFLRHDPCKGGRVHDFGQALLAALRLIGSLDAQLASIVALPLRVSLSATIIAMIIGAPAGAALAISRFRGRQ